jgi:energy-coupling factor transporter transmembrane protein EcfT
MNSYWSIYLIESADTIKFIFILLLIISSIASVTILGMLWSYTNLEDEGFEKKSAKKWLRNAFISNICFLILVLITPSTNTLYKIFGIGTVLEYMKNSDEAKQLPDNALKAINYYLKEIPKEDANKDRK